MKITVIAKAKDNNRKPQNFCPWYIDDSGKNEK